MKKLLSLILTLALLSTLFVFGATSAQAAAVTQTVTDPATTPDIIFVKQTTANSVTTQTFSKTVDSSSPYSAFNNSSRYYWAYLRFPIGSFESITGAVLKAAIRFQGNGWFYIMPSDEKTWAEANAAIESKNGTLTDENDKLLSKPSISSTPANVTDKLDSFAGTQTVSSKSFGKFTYSFTGNPNTYSNTSDSTKGLTGVISGGNLVAKINEAKNSKYVYFAIAYVGKTSNHYGYLYSSSNYSLTLTGERAIEFSTKIVAEKTATVYLDDEIAHLEYGKEGNQYITNEGTYQINKCTHSGTYYEKYLYLKADLSEFAEKDIESVVLKYYGRTFKYNLNLYVSRTNSSWSADSITLENAPESTSNLILAEDTDSDSARAYQKNITSIVDLKTDSVLSLKFEVKSGSSDATHKTGVQIYNVGNSSGSAPRLEITYREELAKNEAIQKGKAFTFQAETTATGAQVMLLVAIYDANGDIIDVVASNVRTAGTDALELPVNLANYANAASVAGYFWDGVTLVPYMEATPADVA